jgi:hypothetical protein
VKDEASCALLEDPESTCLNSIKGFSTISIWSFFDKIFCFEKFLSGKNFFAYKDSYLSMASIDSLAVLPPKVRRVFELEYDKILLVFESVTVFFSLPDFEGSDITLKFLRELSLMVNSF